VTQDVQTSLENGLVCAAVTTILTHASGDRLAFGPLRVPAQSASAQHLAGAVTYARRISLLSTFTLTGEEDLDGEENRPHATPAPRPAPPAASPKAAPATGNRKSAAPSAPAPRANVKTLHEVQVTDRVERVAEDGTWRVVRFTFSDGTTASTFDRNDQSSLEDAAEQGTPVNVSVAPGKKEGYLDIVKGSVVVLERELEADDADDIPF